MKQPEIKTLDKDTANYYKNMVIELIKQIPPVQHQYWSEEHVLLDLLGKWYYSQGAFYEKQLIGFIIASKKDSRTVHIHKYVVKDGFRHKRIGKKLLHELVLLCKSNNILNIKLNIYKVNRSGIKYHKSNTFKIITESKTKLGVSYKMCASVEDVYISLKEEKI